MNSKSLLICGILSSLLYIGMNIFIPMLFEGYSVITQTVSELSAIDAPTRSIWVQFAFLYIILFAGFGIGVWKLSNENRQLRVVAILIFVYAIINFYWPPMHLRGNEPGLTDTLHITWAIATILLMMLIMGFSAAAMGKAFRVYTILTFIIFILFGILIGREAPQISRNLPTPYIGIWERLNIGAFMIWVIVFSVNLIRKDRVQIAGIN